MARLTTHDRVRVRVGALLCGGGATLWDGCMVEPGRLRARQGRVPVPHSTAPITLGGCPRGVAGMGPGLTRAGGGGGGWRTDAGVDVAVAGARGEAPS